MIRPGFPPEPCVDWIRANAGTRSCWRKRSAIGHVRSCWGPAIAEGPQDEWIRENDHGNALETLIGGL